MEKFDRLTGVFGRGLGHGGIVNRVGIDDLGGHRLAVGLAEIVRTAKVRKLAIAGGASRQQQQQQRSGGGQRQFRTHSHPP